MTDGGVSEDVALIVGVVVAVMVLVGSGVALGAMVGVALTLGDVGTIGTDKLFAVTISLARLRSSGHASSQPRWVTDAPLSTSRIINSLAACCDAAKSSDPETDHARLRY
jgi:hypothetical protein